MLMIPTFIVNGPSLPSQYPTENPKGPNGPSQPRQP